MATNFEFYKDEIIEIISCDVAVTKCGRMSCCEMIDCENCIFNKSENLCATPEEIRQWLYAEHIEKPKLTKRERAFCEVVQTGWIARDEDGFLCLFDSTSKPYREGSYWQEATTGSNCIILNSDYFDFIKDTDAECWAVESLLKLEVMDEVQE